MVEDALTERRGEGVVKTRKGEKEREKRWDGVMRDV